jgi:hypothetical protein
MMRNLGAWSERKIWMNRKSRGIVVDKNRKRLQAFWARFVYELFLEV